jgi:hypothetical protein
MTTQTLQEHTYFTLFGDCTQGTPTQSLPKLGPTEKLRAWLFFFDFDEKFLLSIYILQYLLLKLWLKSAVATNHAYHALAEV